VTIWADSRFNASEIQPEPACPVEVVPLVCARPGESAAPDEAVGRRFDDSLKNILFVGRIVPNKCVEDLINMFAWIYRKFDAATRLIIVGSERSCPNYYAMLRMYADRLQLPNVCFAGFVNESELSAFYRAADVFVSSSLHEGFCLPLLEAMANNTPVLARNQGGMPEAVGNAGVLYEDASPRELAVLVNRLLNDRVLREEVLDTQSKRIAEHFGQIGEERIISLLENV
jgi:glycosyltransferase involved in cell wall biosynthesis